MPDKKQDNKAEPKAPAEEEKKPTCFVMMPIADMPGYEDGHFSRVYEHLIKPAVEAAGFEPIRADDTKKTDYIVVGIIQQIIESDIAICDLSGKNANVMYELGIRHAFDKPITLIKDNKTERVFDIQGLRTIDYRADLRIDNVEKDISSITNSLVSTAETQNNSINSIVKLAGIHAAKTPDRTEISSETQLILNAINSMTRTTEQQEDLVPPSEKTQVCLANGSTISIGDRFRDKQTNEIFEIIRLGTNGRIVYLRNTNGMLGKRVSGNSLISEQFERLSSE